MTRYYDSKNKWRMKDDTPISVRNYEHDEPKTYFCSSCNRTLNRLIDSSGQNPSYFCNTCRTEVFPSLTEVRSASKLVTPEGPVEHPSVSYPPERTVGRTPPEIKGGLAELKKRGIRITSYKDGKG
jgi:DNA-directed RNA polymerase subunit RPC12/RpoP